MIQCDSTIKLDFGKISELTAAAVTALEQTAEYVHTEVVQAQVMPRDTGAMQGERTHIKAGQEKVSKYKNGEKAINSISKAENGTVTIATTAPQVRRLYFHPEYHFKKDENPNAKGKWLEDWADAPNGTGKNTQEIREKYAELYRRIAGL